jgi:hypothetical protein
MPFSTCRLNIKRASSPLCIFLVVFCIFFPLTLSLAEGENIERLVRQLKKNSLPDYTKSKLEEIAKSLGSFDDNNITTSDDEDTLHELVRVINNTRSTYHALNYHLYGWNTKLEYLYRANVEAVKRGVTVSRTFILTEDVLYDPAKLLDALRIMETQKKDGIKVMYGLQRDLVAEVNYHKYALMDAGLSDDSVLVWVTAVSLKELQPARIIVTWDQDRIMEKNPFPYLRTSPHIHPFDEEAKKRLLGNTY